MSEYQYGEPNIDKRLPLLSAKPVPPAPFVLLESLRSDSYTGRSTFNDTANHSPLLDTGDELGMRLLLNSATADAEDFKLLSLEEVERLKREKSLLSSRIDAHLRKLALESKVRDASENLVKLHSQKNKRLSKQADDQLQKAARKVEDIATDLWRLQRRESTIKEQLLEHMAGIMSRNIGVQHQTQSMGSPIEFDEDHLYLDSSELSMDLLPSATTARSNVDLIARQNSYDANAIQERLSQITSRIEGLLGAPSKTREASFDSGSGILAQFDAIAEDLDSLEEGFQQRQRGPTNGPALPSENLVRLLYADSDQTRPQRPSEAELEARVRQVMMEIRTLRYDNSESSARASDLEEQHGLAMRQLQSEYEKELDEAHAELDELRQKASQKEQLQTANQDHEERIRNLSSQHAGEIAGLKNELTDAQDSIAQLVLGHANLKDEHSRVKDLNRSLETQLAEHRVRLANSTESREEETKATKNKVSLLESTVARYEAELAVHRERNELSQLELKELEMDRTTERTGFQKKLDELTSKHSYASASLTVMTSEKDIAVSQLEDLRAQMQAKFEKLEAAHSQTRAKLAAQEQEHLARKETDENADRMVKSEVQRLTVQLDTITEELRRALDERARQDVFVSDLEQKLLLAQEEIRTRSRQNEELMHHLQHTKSQSDPSQVTMLQSRCDLLQSELDSMLLEFESMTRTSLDHEMERTRLEDRADELFERVIDLENQVADHKVDTMGQSSPSIDRPLTPASSDDGVTTANLRREFRKLVQEMRMQHAKQTRSDYAEIKRLERLLAANNIYRQA